MMLICQYAKIKLWLFVHNAKNDTLADFTIDKSHKKDYNCIGAERRIILINLRRIYSL